MGGISCCFFVVSLRKVATSSVNNEGNVESFEVHFMEKELEILKKKQSLKIAGAKDAKVRFSKADEIRFMGTTNFKSCGGLFSSDEDERNGASDEDEDHNEVSDDNLPFDLSQNPKRQRF